MYLIFLAKRKQAKLKYVLKSKSCVCVYSEKSKLYQTNGYYYKFNINPRIQGYYD